MCVRPMCCGGRRGPQGALAKSEADRQAALTRVEDLERQVARLEADAARAADARAVLQEVGAAGW